MNPTRRLLALTAVALVCACRSSGTQATTATIPTETLNWCTPKSDYIATASEGAFWSASTSRFMFIAQIGLDCPDLGAAFQIDPRQCGQGACTSIPATSELAAKAIRDLATAKVTVFSNIAGCNSITHLVGLGFEAIGLCADASLPSFPIVDGPNGNPSSEQMPSAFEGCIEVPCLPNNCTAGDDPNHRQNVQANPGCECPQTDVAARCQEVQAADCTCYEFCCRSTEE